MGIYANDVQKLYIAYFNRPADPVGLAYWEEQITKNGGSTAAVANAFSASAEYKAMYDGKASAAIVDAIYQNLFGRAAEADGLVYWGVRLENGTFNVGSIAMAILTGAQNDDKKVIDNKVVVASSFTTNLDTAAEILAYAGTAAAEAARTFLKTVGATDASLTTAKAGVDAAITSIASTTVANGTTFTLTTGADTLTGTDNNDTFAASVVYGSDELPATASTFTVADAIKGGNGIDTLNLVISGAQDAAVTLPAANLTGIEVINVRNTVAQTANLDASTVAGLTAFNADRAVGKVAVTNLASGASVGVTGDGTAATGAVDFSYATGATAVTINAANGTKSGANLTNTDAASAIKTVTINSTGAANTLGTLELDGDTVANEVTALTVNAASNLTATLTADDFAATAKITVAGAAKSVNLGSNANVKTIDASGLTAGGLTIALGTNTTSFLGGQGDDVVSTAALASTAVIDGNTGTDVLVVSAATDVDSAAKGGLYKGFDIVRTANSQDMSVFTATTISGIQMEAATAKTLSKVTAAQAGAITVRGDQATSFTVTLADATGTADAVTLNLASATATSNVDVAGLSVVGVETLNLNATTGTAGTTSDVAFGVGGADKLTAINLSGTADAKVTGTNTAKAVTFVSTSTGAVTVDGNFVNGSSITTGAGKDTLTLGTGFGTYNAGAGDDTINATAAQLNTGANYNVVNGGEGTDTLNITDGATATINIVDNNLSKISGIEKIVVASTTTGSQTIQTGGWFDAAFKATGVDLTTTSTTGAIAIDMTSFTGAATLTTTSTTGNQTIQTGTTGGNDKVTAVATTGNVTVTTAAGDDVVSVTTAGTGVGEGAITISTGAGNDIITVVNAAAGDNATITAGAGADKITLGTDAAVIVIGNTDSGITVVTADTIVGFKTTADTLKLGFNGGATNATEAAAAVTDFATALTNANAALAALKVANPASTELANFQWDATNGYLFNDTDANGSADQVIVLVGITGATFAVTDIVA